MKKTYRALMICLTVLLFASCTKTESDFSTPIPETIILSSDANSLLTGNSATFSVRSSTGSVTTGDSKIFIDDTVITGNTHLFSTEGTFLVYATKGDLKSNSIAVHVYNNVIPVTGFVDKVLVEEYSGTWCGNCPRILYGVELLHQQTSKAIVVGFHLSGNDPFITTQGNNLAASLGVSGVPTGYINRTISWNGPQYENVSQVTDQLQPIKGAGLSISSVSAGNVLNAVIRISYKQAITGNAKLTVYLVEDKLYNSQRNYSSNLYGGQATIPVFEYNGVLRSVVSDLAGDPVPNSGTMVEKPYSFQLPGNISNVQNLRLVAFVTDGSGKVANAQDAKINSFRDFEEL